MKRSLPIPLTIFLGYVAWCTIKALDSPLRPSGVRDVYAYHNLEQLYYALIAFSLVAGSALAFAVWKAKPWGYVLGYLWLAVGMVHTVFVGISAYTERGLILEILMLIGESRGRDLELLPTFVYSPFYDGALAGVMLVLVAISAGFMVVLYRARDYFGYSK